MSNLYLSMTLIEWLNKAFSDVYESEVKFADLYDGVLLAKALHRISPQIFTDTWLLRLKSNAPDNVRVRVLNLTKVIKGIEDFNLEVMKSKFKKNLLPDIQKISDHSDEEELGLLLQLVLGCAVNCPSKQFYVECIMALDEAKQHVIMKAIQAMMDKENQESEQVVSEDSGSRELEQQLRQITQQYFQAAEQRDETLNRCQQLDQQLVTAQEESTSILAENHDLKERLESYDDHDSSALLIQKYSSQQTINKLQFQLEYADSSREDYKLKANVLSDEVLRLQSKVQDLEHDKESSRSLKDKIEILKHNETKVEKLESVLESYKEKLSDIESYTSRIQNLEHKNKDSLQQNHQLEESIRKMEVMKQQLEKNRIHLHECQMRLDGEKQRVERSECETKQLREKLDQIETESQLAKHPEFHYQESTLNNELRQLMAQSPSHEVDSAGDVSSATKPDTLASLNKYQINLTMEEEDDIRQQLVDNKSRIHSLQSETSELNLLVKELKQLVEDDKIEKHKLRKLANDKCYAAEVSHNEMMDFKTEITQVKQTYAKLDTENSTLQQSNVKLQQSVHESEEFSKESAVRYESYLEKARQMIETYQDAATGDTSKAEYASLRDNHIRRLNIENKNLKEENRILVHLEDKMTAAFYHMASKKNNDIVDRNIKKSLVKGLDRSFDHTLDISDISTPPKSSKK